MLTVHKVHWGVRERPSSKFIYVNPRGGLQFSCYSAIVGIESLRNENCAIVETYDGKLLNTRSMFEAPELALNYARELQIKLLESEKFLTPEEAENEKSRF